MCIIWRYKAVRRTLRSLEMILVEKLYACRDAIDNIFVSQF